MLAMSELSTIRTTRRGCTILGWQPAAPQPNVVPLPVPSLHTVRGWGHISRFWAPNEFWEPSVASCRKVTVYTTSYSVAVAASTSASSTVTSRTRKLGMPSRAASSSSAGADVLESPKMSLTAAV